MINILTIEKISLLVKNIAKLVKTISWFYWSRC